MEIIQNHKKYPFIIFSVILIMSVLIFHFVQAYNPDKHMDTDNDGLTDWEEKVIYQTFWDDADTDKDGYPDGHEVKYGYSPKQPKLKMWEADTDNDGLNDDWEIKLNSNLMIRDTDGDGYLDGTEVYNGYSPTNPKPIRVSKKIEISKTELKLKFYFDNILLENYDISTGKPSTPTPLGEFKIMAKVDVKHYNGAPNTKWNMHFATVRGLRYYIHGAYWHDKFGEENVSGGCVNVRYEDMERLYIFTSIGTPVTTKE